MPVIGQLVGGMQFTDLKWTLKPAETAADGTVVNAVTMNYGLFIQNIIDFLIIAFFIFLFIKLITRLTQKKETPAAPPAPPVPTKEEVLLTEIRDLLKEQSKK